MEKLDEIKYQKCKTSLSEFITTLRASGLNREQKNYIQNLTLPEIENWLEDLEDPKMIEFVSTLRHWSAYVKTGQSQDDPNSDTLINQALEKIAKDNPLNKYRVDDLIKRK